MARRIRQRYAQYLEEVNEEKAVARYLAGMADLGNWIAQNVAITQLPSIPVLATLAVFRQGEPPMHLEEQSAFLYRSPEGFKVLCKGPDEVLCRILLPQDREVYLAGDFEVSPAWDNWLRVREVVYHASDAQLGHLSDMSFDDLQEALHLSAQFPRYIRALGIPSRSQLQATMLKLVYQDHGYRRQLMRELLKIIYPASGRQGKNQRTKHACWCVRVPETILTLLGQLLLALPQGSKWCWNAEEVFRAVQCDPRALAANLSLVNIPLRSLLWLGTESGKARKIEGMWVPGPFNLPYPLWLPLSQSEETKAHNQTAGSAAPSKNAGHPISAVRVENNADWAPLAYSDKFFREHWRGWTSAYFVEAKGQRGGEAPREPASVLLYESAWCEQVFGNWLGLLGQSMDTQFTDRFMWGNVFRGSGRIAIPITFVLLQMREATQRATCPFPGEGPGENDPSLALYGRALLPHNIARPLAPLGGYIPLVGWALVSRGEVAAVYGAREAAAPVAYVAVIAQPLLVPFTSDFAMEETGRKAELAHVRERARYLWLDPSAHKKKSHCTWPDIKIESAAAQSGTILWPYGLSYESAINPPSTRLLGMNDFLPYHGLLNSYFTLCPKFGLASPPPPERLLCKQGQSGYTRNETNKGVRFNRLQANLPVVYQCATLTTHAMQHPWSVERKLIGLPFLKAVDFPNYWVIRATAEEGEVFGLSSRPIPTCLHTMLTCIEGGQALDDEQDSGNGYLL